ncbi:hypothetical protein [Bacillus licheniformis]|uniref:hypothetical protein n=1 Tax=Bacillus licheniformis TaxID=1402 RepID=UPI000948BED0|nr:hypothetical protein [Bacillus licheniformis]AUZ30172.1 hypothetical protein C1T27_07410 [Bacillus licheniformis]OKS82993.1 hypothetical protein BFN05_07795 [Bacillus licheniformis]
MECYNRFCLWNVFGSCCHESEEGMKKATPNQLDCPSSLRADFEEQLNNLLNECIDLLMHRNMKELIEVKKFINEQRS